MSGALEEIAVAVIVDGDEVLVTRRAPDAAFADHDEFPGGHREQGESLEDCLRREVREETGLEVEPAELLASAEVPTALGRRCLWFYECRLREPRPAQLELAREPRWVPRNELGALRFPPANQQVVDLLRERGDQRPGGFTQT